MPIQRTLGGKPISIPTLPRRFRIVFILTGVLITLIIFMSQSAVSIPDTPLAANLRHTAQKAADRWISKKIPKLWNPFEKAVHAPPPVQANSTHGGSSWYADWKWLNPFSSSVTLDQNRAVLPPSPRRIPIYTFYDPQGHKDSKILDADHELLLTWRRAWWAQGFKPIVLGMPEALNNPLSERVKALSLKPELDLELHRWLAWGHMEGGILANYLTLPMASYDDAMLKHLRRGEIDRLTRYEGLQDGLFVGAKADINHAIKEVFWAHNLKTALSPIDAIPMDSFQVIPRHDGVAYYDISVIKKKYKAIEDELTSSTAAGLHSLARLINSHLQLIWQNTFKDGITILQHLPRHGNILIEPSIDIARNLTQCVDSPLPKSCPPNVPRCTPCDPHKTKPIKLAQSYHNTSDMFSIGIVPHPYTTTSLHYFKDSLDTAFVRRNTTRDDWLVTVGKALVGVAKESRGSLSGPQLLVPFKGVVASEDGGFKTLWLTPEKPNHDELEWIFGFSLPRSSNEHARPSGPDPVGDVATPAELAREEQVLESARVVVQGRYKSAEQTRAMVEAWNLADAEAWRFVMAFNARRRMERLKWEEEERAFAGSERRVDGWGGWFASL